MLLPHKVLPRQPLVLTESLTARFKPKSCNKVQLRSFSDFVGLRARGANDALTGSPSSSISSRLRPRTIVRRVFGRSKGPNSSRSVCAPDDEVRCQAALPPSAPVALDPCPGPSAASQLRAGPLPDMHLDWRAFPDDKVQRGHLNALCVCNPGLQSIKLRSSLPAIAELPQLLWHWRCCTGAFSEQAAECAPFLCLLIRYLGSTQSHQSCRRRKEAASSRLIFHTSFSGSGTFMRAALIFCVFWFTVSPRNKTDIVTLSVSFKGLQAQKPFVGSDFSPRGRGTSKSIDVEKITSCSPFA